ncbi:MAG: hypothetical protein WC047_05085 [Kiritimatiellales bacterium]
MNVYIDLVLDNGELVRIECHKKDEDELFETIESTMKCRDWWSPLQFNDCRADYLGMNLDQVNMARVIGLLR